MKFQPGRENNIQFPTKRDIILASTLTLATACKEEGAPVNEVIEGGEESALFELLQANPENPKEKLYVALGSLYNGDLEVVDDPTFDAWITVEVFCVENDDGENLCLLSLGVEGTVMGYTNDQNGWYIAESGWSVDADGYTELHIEQMGREIRGEGVVTENGIEDFYLVGIEDGAETVITQGILPIIDNPWRN